MEQPSTSRPKLIPRKFNASSHRIQSAHYNNNNDDFPQSRGFKRKNTEEISAGGKQQFTERIHTGGGNICGGNKYSANARLMQYRKVLESKKNELVKVHTLLKPSETVNQCSKEVTEGCFKGNTQPVPPQKSSINRRLNMSTQTPTASLYNSNPTSSSDWKMFETATNHQNSPQQISANQRLKTSTKEDYKHKSSFSFVASSKDCNRNFETPTTSRQKVFPQNSIIQHVNTSTKADCRQKSNTFSFTPTTSVSGVQGRLKKYKDSALIVEKTSNNAAFGNEDVDMDWSPISEEQLITDINNMRQNAHEILSHKSSFQEIISAEIPKNDFVFKDTYIAVDTNIFLSHLDIVQHLLNIYINGAYRPLILIPWVVIQELDYMKDGRDGRQVLQRSARKAINFINENLLREGTTLKGQSVIDATKHSIPCNNLDDGIVACCLQVIERGNRSILLSNDNNLRNKCLINAIPAYSSKEIFQKLCVASPSKQNSTMQSLPKSDEVRRHLSTLFNTIIHSEGLSVYGDYYHKMSVFKKAPWTLEECLRKFEKLWMTMFSTKLPKLCLQNIEEMKKLLTSRKCIITEDEHQSLVKYGLSICYFLKDGMSDYFLLTAECIERIIKLA